MMFIIRVSLALLPFAVRIVASSVPLPFELSVPESPCETEPYWIQPIAISLGLDSIMAAYAHWDTNISIIATITPPDPDPRLTAYGRTIAHLRKQHVDDYKNSLTRDPENRITKAVNVVVNVLETVAHVAELFWTEVFLRTLDESKEMYSYPIWVSAHVVTYEYRQLVRGIRYIAGKIDWTEKPEKLDLDYAQNGFKQALTLVRNRAYTNTGINITAATIIYPDFFPWDVGNRVRAAAYDAGMETPTLPALTKRQVFEWHANALLFNRTSTRQRQRRGYNNDDDDQPSLILLEQGVAHFDLLTSGKHCMIQHPMDHLRCTNIVLALWVEFKERNQDVKEELVAGQSWPALRRELARARESLKEYRQQKGEEGEQVEEWPLNLDGWWSSEEKRRPVVLRWEDVQTVDEIYVASLAGPLDQVQLCLQGATRSPAPASSKSVQGVAVMGSSCDGSLLQRAIKRSMGEHVHIFGSSDPGQDMTYMARLGARAALRIRQQVAEEMELDCRIQDELLSWEEQQEEWWYGNKGKSEHSDAQFFMNNRDEL